MRYRSIVIAALSTTFGIAVVQATSALSALRLTPSASTAEVPPNSLRASVADVVATPQGPVVLLRPESSDRLLPIWVGYAEARAIERVLSDIDMPRPMTHDLFAKTLGRLDARLVHVRVDRLRPDGVYVGTATLQQDDRIIKIDTRPSDAMALALRTSAPIYIDSSLRAQLVEPMME